MKYFDETGSQYFNCLDLNSLTEFEIKEFMYSRGDRTVDLLDTFSEDQVMDLANHAALDLFSPEFKSMIEEAFEEIYGELMPVV